ncbi:D-alanyl-D-alanine carboxypeptidase/D-alanyl-D-alanine-endopeptidase [candidate division BRC1 bacterium HGW-BRC1-1]|jgi:D-alanyl-D-alanine carboxypeptidase/D-alanyl-D-alanine-endopeptidase (penicillin-binding protein 4)|nr:MAG: D-alanyl-D-alanine carboxypeptidase/D-alanyl-D-alanine-endopeptidase [candidate division BRC1 bacterium HGW-BRC1-1]
MPLTTSFRISLAICAAFFASPLIAQGSAAQTQSAEFSAYVEEVASSKPYESGVFAVCFMNPDGRTELLNVNGGKSVLPASCMKTVSSGIAMSHLGPDHRFHTDVITSGSVVNGLLNGDLVVRGGGDPTLGSDRVKGSLNALQVIDEIVSTTRAVGIQSITGDVVGDDSYFPWDPIPDGWDWQDIGNYYGAGTSGLCFSDNLYHLRFKPGKSVNDPAQIIASDPPLPGVEWVNEMRTGAAGSGDQGYIYGAPAGSLRWVRGTVPAGDIFSIRGSLPDPALTCAHMLKAALNSQGIRVGGIARSTRGKSEGTGGSKILTLESPRVADIMFNLNKESFNLYAEMMLMHTSRSADDGLRAAGVKLEEKFLKEANVPMNGWNITDGSGLGRTNTVTAIGMVHYLSALMKKPHFKEWKNTIAVMGVDGDLAKRSIGTPLVKNVIGKTGYIGGSRGLVGYLTTHSGKELTFAILANHFDGTMKSVDADIDKVLLKAYETW